MANGGGGKGQESFGGLPEIGDGETRLSREKCRAGVRKYQFLKISER